MCVCVCDSCVCVCVLRVCVYARARVCARAHARERGRAPHSSSREARFTVRILRSTHAHARTRAHTLHTRTHTHKAHTKHMTQHTYIHIYKPQHDKSPYPPSREFHIHILSAGIPINIYSQRGFPYTLSQKFMKNKYSQREFPIYIYF